MTDNEIQSHDCALFVVIVLVMCVALSALFVCSKLEKRIAALEAVTAKEAK